VFNEGAKKIRTVSAKESNYFNILQNIAETFEGWLDLEIKRDEYGGIEEKKVTFKNYLGETNYANFRYGVNLKDIQRTTSSKNIVSKLIVKQNSNELGQDGFCTIQRAAANPTGENYIYDFQYYHNQGLMDAAEYFDTIYYLTGAKG
jgi:phage minor structural protein